MLSADELSADERRFFDAVIGVPIPWRIARVDVGVADARLDVHVEPSAGASWPCPACQAPLLSHELGPARTWRHRDLGELRTFLHARVPLVSCPRHGVGDVCVPWAEAACGFTTAMVRHIVALTESGGVNMAARVLQIRWEDALHLLLVARAGA